MTTFKTPLEGACFFLKSNRPIFPIVPGGKTPAIEGNREASTTSQETIANWHAALASKGTRRTPCNWGYFPSLGGETVIDLDNHAGKNGKAALTEWAASLGQTFPATFTVQTPSGGLHLYFKGALAGSKDSFLPGVDVHSTGKYVVVPGSHTNANPKRKTVEGWYQVIDDREPAELPTWFIEQWNAKKPSAAAAPVTPLNVRIDPDTPEKVAAAIEIITNWPEAVEGERNEQLHQLACELCKAGVSEAKAKELYAEYGIERLSYGNEDEWKEVEKTIHSAYNGKIAEFGSTSDQAASQVFGPAKFDAEDWDTMEQLSIPDRKWFIRDWLVCEPGTVHLFAGQGGTGKSLIGFMLGFCLATGEDWLGMKIERRAKSFIVSCEDSRDEQARRIQRIRKMYGRGAGKGIVKVWCRAGENNVLATATRQGLVIETEFMKELKAKCAAHFGKDGGIVILDTLSDFVAINENDRMQVSQFVKHILSHFASELGVTVVLLAHPNKSNREYSGSSAWEAAARSRWSLKWENEKQTGKNDTLILALEKANTTMRGKTVRLQYGPDFLPHVVDTVEENTELQDKIIKMVADAEAEGNPFGASATSERSLLFATIEDPSTGVPLTQKEITAIQRELISNGKLFVRKKNNKKHLSTEPPKSGKENEK